jgi:glycosyl transferase family 25
MIPQALKIFVISLERATERRAHMQALLDQLGLQAEFILAVDGRALTAADRARYDSRRARLHYRSEMTDAEIACYLSHYRCYERIARERLPMALILEDDIAVGPNFVSTIRQLASQANPSWTVVRLQSQRSKVLKPRTAKEQGRWLCDLEGGILTRLGTHVLGGCAYLMRLPAAEAMLTYGRRIVRPIDQTLDRYWENGIMPHVVRPFPVWQHPAFASEIGDRGKARNLSERPIDRMFGRMVRLLDGLNKRAYALQQASRAAVPASGLSLRPRRSELAT